MKSASKLLLGMIVLTGCATPASSGAPAAGASAPGVPTPAAADVFDPIKWPAGVSVEHSVKRYIVTGIDRRAIRAQLHVPDGTVEARRYAGQYLWQLSWRYMAGRDGASCRVTRATVTLTASVTIPEWTPPAAVDSSLTSEWTRFRRALVLHEQGHRDLAYAGAARMRRALEGVPMQSCGAIDADVRRTAEPILIAMKAEQARYDSTTRHGATQGATF